MLYRCTHMELCRQRVCILKVGPTTGLMFGDETDNGILITVNAAVAGLEVSNHVLGTGLLLVERGVRQLDHTRRSSGAAGVEYGQHVGRAADVYVRVDAATELHSTELGRLHDDSVAERTAGVERFPLAVVLHERCV